LLTKSRNEEEEEEEEGEEGRRVNKQTFKSNNNNNNNNNNKRGKAWLDPAFSDKSCFARFRILVDGSRLHCISTANVLGAIVTCYADYTNFLGRAIKAIEARKLDPMCLFPMPRGKTSNGSPALVQIKVCLYKCLELLLVRSETMIYIENSSQTHVASC
jgi:hypothetical protein